MKHRGLLWPGWAAQWSSNAASSEWTEARRHRPRRRWKPQASLWRLVQVEQLAGRGGVLTVEEGAGRVCYFFPRNSLIRSWLFSLAACGTRWCEVGCVPAVSQVRGEWGVSVLCHHGTSETPLNSLVLHRGSSSGPWLVWCLIKLSYVELLSREFQQKGLSACTVYSFPPSIWSTYQVHIVKKKTWITKATVVA